VADPSDPRRREVDDLRQQLRSLGYLDAGVDRFVLGAAQATRRPGAIALLTSLRIGALAALLLGPAAAIGVATRMPGLITGARDGFVVAAYLGALFGGASFLVALLLVLGGASLAAATNAVGRRTVALIAGGIFTALCLAYLTLWWDASTLSAGSAEWRSAWTLLAIALAAAISLLLGHLVTVTTLAVVVARTGEAGQSHGVPGTSRRVLFTAGTLMIVGALLLLNLSARTEVRPAETPTLAVVSSGVRVRLIAIDGFDAEIARRLTQRGTAPALAAMLSGSVARLETGDTRDPARAWTTVATGQPPEVHAVHALETRRVAGVQGTLTGGDRSPLARSIDGVTDLLELTSPSIVSGAERRVKTLWEVAASAGLRTAVVNWWATWPAPAHAGIVISDRATLRLERGGGLDAEIAPVETYEALRARWPELRATAAAAAGRIHSSAEMETTLRRSAELDALQVGIANAVTTATTDLVCTYLPGLDLVQHAVLAGEGPQTASAVAERLGALEQYYAALDALLAPVLQPSRGEIVFIVASPGRVESDAAGLFVALGEIANTRLKDGTARATDVMPTVLHALGVPISRELAGRPLIEMFSAAFARQAPVRQVRTYGPPTSERAPRQGQPLDQEMIDRLRSLGYVR
jgi:hypothetical protein